MSNSINMNIRGLQHVGLPTEKMDQTKEFFAKLGFTPAYETVNDGACVSFMKQNSLVIEIYEVDQAADCYGALEHIALDVDDVEKVYEAICEMGLNTLNDEIHYLPFWENGVRFFTIEGPNKEKVEFSQML